MYPKYLCTTKLNQLSTYEHTPQDTTSLYQLAERVIYGSSRLGLNTNKVDMLDENPEELLSLSLGNKLYELLSFRPLKNNYQLKK